MSLQRVGHARKNKLKLIKKEFCLRMSTEFKWFLIGFKSDVLSLGK